MMWLSHTLFVLSDAVDTTQDEAIVVVAFIFSRFVPLSMAKAVGHPVQCSTSVSAALVYKPSYKEAIIMPYPTLTAEEIARRGEEIYARDLRAKLETEENRGQFLIIDIATGDYEINKEDLIATEQLLTRHPNAMTYGLRIGYEAAYELGGHLLGNVP